MTHRPIAEILADRDAAADEYRKGGFRGDPNYGRTFFCAQKAIKAEIIAAARSYTANMHLHEILDLAIEKTEAGPLRGLLAMLNAMIKDPEAEDTDYTGDKLMEYARNIAAEPAATLGEA